MKISDYSLGIKFISLKTLINEDYDFSHNLSVKTLIDSIAYLTLRGESIIYISAAPYAVVKETIKLTMFEVNSANLVSSRKEITVKLPKTIQEVFVEFTPEILNSLPKPNHKFNKVIELLCEYTKVQ